MSRVSISKKIPAPEVTLKTGLKPVSSIPEGYSEDFPFTKLEVKDCMFVPYTTSYEMRNHTYKATTKLGYQLVTRTTENSRGTPGVRIWRVQ